MPNVRLAENVYQTATGFRVLVREPDPVTGRSTRVTKRFPRGTPLEILIAYRDARQAAATEPELEAAGFTADARRYLALEDVKRMPSFRTRQIEIDKWIGIFGDMPRTEINKNMINDALHRLNKPTNEGGEGYANSTCNNFRTALMSLWTTLDGRDAANPVRGAVVFEEPPLIPRGQSYELLTLILDAIPDERGLKVDRATLYKQVWNDPATDVARHYGVSSSFLKRLCRSLIIPTPPRGYWTMPPYARGPRPALPRGVPHQIAEPLKSRARLEVLAWTGMDPGQLGRMTTEHFSFADEGWYTPPHRKKGRRTRRAPRPVVRLPMTPDSRAAFQRLVEVNGLGPFSVQSLAHVWERACRRVERKLRKDYRDETFTIPHIRLKDLRHSFGTRLWEDTKGDESTVAKMLQHAPGSPMTIRYSLGAVSEVLRQQLKNFRGRKPGSGTGLIGAKRPKVVPIRPKH